MNEYAKRIFILPHGMAEMMSYFVNDLVIDRDKRGGQWRVTVEPYKRKRTLDQNAYLHAVPLKIISQHTGHDLEELKEYLCGEAFGWKEITIGERTISKPVKTTSQLNVEQFTWFIEWVLAWASNELNLRIPLPEEK